MEDERQNEKNQQRRLKRLKDLKLKRLKESNSPNKDLLIKEFLTLEVEEKRLITQYTTDTDREYKINRMRVEAQFRARRRALGTDDWSVNNQKKRRSTEDLDKDELEFRNKRIADGKDDDRFYQPRIRAGYENIKKDWDLSRAQVNKLEEFIINSTSEKEVDALFWSIKNVYRDLRIQLS